MRRKKKERMKMTWQKGKNLELVQPQYNDSFGIKTGPILLAKSENDEDPKGGGGEKRRKGVSEADVEV